MQPCPSCGTENADDARFCSSCGATLIEPCPSCGSPLPEAARFCPTCGQEVAPAAPGQERKLVTVLFADVAESTALGEQLDAESLKEVMGAFFEAMREQIEAEGGTVEKFIGDAVMAVFGVPAAHEDDPARALRAALAMQERLADLNDELSRRHGVELAIRVGINTGEVVAVTEPRPGEPIVSGDTVNAAARLEQTAQPGEVLVGGRTARATRGFRFDDAGELALRGKARAVAAVRLVEAYEAPERGVPGLRAPMVGRDRELAVLRSLYERVGEERNPQLVTLYGDAGVGKSRLVAEFLASLEISDEAPLVLRGRCVPYGEGITYWPLAEILKGIAGVLDTDPPELVVEKIRKVGLDLLTPDLAPDPARATAALAYTVGVEDPETPLTDLPPRQVRLEVHAAWRSFFSALASDQPVVIVIEDIHWGDAALLDLLEELADRARGPLLLLCPARPELTGRRATWGGGKRNFSSAFLEPLSRDDADRMVGFLLSVEDLPKAAHDRILERAEGNPFFLEEIVRHLIDQGHIVREGDRWRAASAIGEVEIPDTVQAVLAARIDLLEPAEKRALQSAAVVGRVFWAGPVGRLLEGESDELDRLLETLEERELVLARLGTTMAGDREYLFKHVLTRDVAYESLPRRDRSAAHATVAGWIEETAGERRREFAELLAYHYVEAHDGAKRLSDADAEELGRLRQKAFEYLLLASDEARRKLVAAKARSLADEAFALAATPLERAWASELLGEIAFTDYRGDLGWRYFRQTADIRLAGVPEDRIAIARVCGRAVEFPTRWPGSMRELPPEEDCARYLETGLAHAGDADSVELARLLTARGFWPFAFPAAIDDQALEEARVAAERAVAVADRLGDRSLLSAALDALGGQHMDRGEWRDVDRITLRRMEVARTLEDPFELGDIHAVRAWAEFHIGRYGEAFRVADEGVRRASEAPGTEIHCLTWRTAARCRLGDWAGTIADAQLAETLMGERIETPPGFSRRMFAAAAFVHDAQGNTQAADRYLTQILSLGEKEWGGLYGAIAWVGLILARRGSFDEADRVLEERDPSGSLQRVSIILEARCDLVAERGSWDEAAGLLERARAHAELGGLLALPAYADRLEGRAALASGEAEAAASALERAGDAFERLEARWERAVTDLSLADALVAMGDVEGARKVLTRSLPVLEELRSVREIDAARGRLSRLG